MSQKWPAWVLVAGIVGSTMLPPAPALAAVPNSCGFSKASDDAIAAAQTATDQGQYITALQYQIQAQALDEATASRAASAQQRATCFSSVLASGVTLVQNEVLYGASQEAWQYARHLTAIWSDNQGTKLSPAQRAGYDTFFLDIAQALRGCDPGGCDISDLETAQTKNDLLAAI